jgi:dTDP-4-amino-4,6-dideoxygalactose transaminase
MRDLNPLHGPAYSRNARPYLYGDELNAVAAVLDTGQYGHGEVTEQFERALADFLGIEDVVAVANGTTALHIALAVAGVGPGDEVVVPSMTFCATVQAILACGAEPRFAEVDPASMCMTAANVREALTPSTRAVMPVLYGGRAVDLSEVREELDDRGIVVVEDAAHAFGSWAGDVRVGAAGHLTCFSFGPIKNLTCGQGGALVPRNTQEVEHARHMRLLGMVESPAERARSTAYRVQGVGVRGHLSQINAAIGLAQLARFPAGAAKRADLWRSYEAALDGVAETRLIDVDVARSVPSMCAVLVADRDRVFHALQQRGIGVGTHYPPNHLQPAFAACHRPLPVTERLGREILTLPFHQAMETEDVAAVVTALKGALR